MSLKVKEDHPSQFNNQERKQMKGQRKNLAVFRWSRQDCYCWLHCSLLRGSLWQFHDAASINTEKKKQGTSWMKHTEKSAEVKQSCQRWQVLISASHTHQAEELGLGKKILGVEYCPLSHYRLEPGAKGPHAVTYTSAWI